MKPYDRFTDGHYQGYTGHSVYNRYNVIKISSNKNWDLQKFNVNGSSDSLMRFSDYECVLFGNNFRNTLPDELLPVAKTQMTKALQQFDRMVRHEGTLKIREPTRFVFQDDDKEEKKSKKQQQQEKYDGSNAILQVMMGMVNDKDTASEDYEKHYKTIQKFAEDYANDAAKVIHSRSTEGIALQKKLKGKSPGAKSLDDLDYEDGSLEAHSPSIMRARTSLLGNTVGSHTSENPFTNMLENLDDSEEESEDGGLHIDEIMGMLDDEFIEFTREDKSEFDAIVTVAASDEAALLDLFNGSENPVTDNMDKIAQLRSGWQYQFVKAKSSNDLKCYHILPKSNATKGKRKDPPETLEQGKKKAGKSKTNERHAHMDR